MATTDLGSVTPAGKLQLRFHQGQWRAWQSRKRFVLVLAGTQSGKTSFGPSWLYREVQQRGPGDYLVATPTFPLLQLKLLPEFRRLFEDQLRVGRYVESPTKKFTFSPDGARRTFGTVGDVPTQVFFGHAQDPDSLESATGKGAWLDEAGQRKFKRGSFEAILRRLSIHEGRVLLTTTPYALGWLKSELYDPFKASGANHPSIDVINFRSVDNPAFPRAEYERARASLPDWKFRMFYDGIFMKPAGLIYDCFDEKRHVVSPFVIPESWPRHLGLDFGGVNTAGLFIAENPANRELFAYREYLAGGRTAAEHATQLRKGEPRLPTAVGGSRSEGQWRAEFAAGGLPVLAPAFSDVEVGIDRLYSLIKTDRLKFFNTLTLTLEQLLTYSRVLDDNGEPTADIEDKETFHLLDAARSAGGRLSAPAPTPSRGTRVFQG